MCPGETQSSSRPAQPSDSSRAKKLQVILGNTNLNRIPRLEIPLQNLLRQRILNLLLYRPLQGPRPVYRIETGVRKLVPRSIRQVDANIPFSQPFVQVAKLDVDDLANM